MRYFKKVEDNLTSIYECEINPCDAEEITKRQYNNILKKIKKPEITITEYDDELLAILNQ